MRLVSTLTLAILLVPTLSATRTASACTTLTIPTTITTAGVYCLTAATTYTPSTGYTSAIQVQIPSGASNKNVVIDLGGYELSCSGTNCASNTTGIYSISSSGLVVQNGRLAFFNIGVYLYSGINATIRDVRFFGMTDGIYGDGSFNNVAIQNNTFESTSTGVYLYNPVGYYNIDGNAFYNPSIGIYVTDTGGGGSPVAIVGNHFFQSNTYNFYLTIVGSTVAYRDNLSLGGGTYTCASGCTHLYNAGNNQAY
jgi:nitrous oxidase accessory protein NosD